MDRDERVTKILLTLIIGVGTFLRFYKCTTLPLMHDEMSALFRLDFDNFHDLIQYGVLPDGHPAGVQVFLYYWVKLFGNEDFTLRLPFIVLGTLSVPLVYVLCKKWFSNTTALLTSAYIATLQFPIFYSQLARPYAMGMFFTILAAIFWTDIIEKEQMKIKSKSVFYFVLSSVMTCYIHYFSMLFILVMCLSGFWMLDIAKWKNYFYILIIVLIAYAPHFSIFYHHLFENRGLEWLAMPRKDFPIEYIRYIFQFSWVLIGLFLAISMFGILKYQKCMFNQWKYKVISITWFLFPLVLGVLYSLYVKPVIQYSMLLFTMPYFLFFFLSFYKNQSNLFNSLAVVGILMSNSFFLVTHRKHYQMMEKQPFARMAFLSDSLSNDYKKSSRYIGGNPKMINKYLHQGDDPISFTSIHNYNHWAKDFVSLITLDNNDYVMCGNLPLEDYAIIQKKYPYLLFVENGFTYEFYLFAKHPNKKAINDTIFNDSLSENSSSRYWKGLDHIVTAKDSNTTFFVMGKENEFGPTFEAPLGKIMQSKDDILDIYLNVKSVEQSKVKIVAHITSNDMTIDYRSQDISQYHEGLDWHQVHFSIRMTDIFKKRNEYNACTIRIYPWNMEAERLELRNFEIRTRIGNPLVYGLIEDMN